MAKEHKYKIWGFTIISEIEMPDLTISEGIPEVEIRFDKVPEHISDPISKGVCYEAKQNVILIKVLDVARFLISNGKTIIIEPLSDENENSLRLFLQTSAFGALLHQREYLILHGSAVKIENEAVIFSGVSGAGKSTTAAMFNKIGYPLIADDISPIKFTRSGSEIYASPPFLKLWQDSVEKLNLQDSKIARVRTSMEKFFIKTDSFPVIEKLPLKKIFVLSSGNSDNISLVPISGIEKFNIISHQTYRYNFIKGMALEKNHFIMASKLASQIEICCIYRNTQLFETNKLIRAILDNLASKPNV